MKTEVGLLLILFVSGVTSLIYNIYPFAGSGTSATSGSGGPASAANFNGPRSIWQDSQFNFYVVESGGSCMRKIDSSTYIVSDFAGVCGSAGSTGDSGPATSCKMNIPIGYFADSTSQHFLAEYSGNKIRKISSNNIASTYAGTGIAASTGNGGKATAATVNGVCGMWGNTVGYIVFTEFLGQYVRSVTPTGIVALVAGDFTNLLVGVLDVIIPM